MTLAGIVTSEWPTHTKNTNAAREDVFGHADRLSRGGFSSPALALLTNLRFTRTALIFTPACVYQLNFLLSFHEILTRLN